MRWLRLEIATTEEGVERWKQVVEFVTTPPVSVLAVVPSAEDERVRVSRPDRLPPGAPLTPEQEAAAFAAFEGMTT